MMVQSIHRFLVEFKPDAPAEPMREPANGDRREEASGFLPPDPPDLDAIADGAYRRGCDETKARAAMELESALAIAREEADETLASARAQWVTEESEALAARLINGLAVIEGRLAEKTSRALRPFLNDAVREQAIAALCETLRQLLQSRSTTTLEMAGPKDLLEAVMRRLDGCEGKLDGYEAKIVTQITSDRDIRVVCDETTIETQIALWAKSLAIDGA
jgi:hypothetical protein